MIFSKHEATPNNPSTVSQFKDSQPQKEYVLEFENVSRQYQLHHEGAVNFRERVGHIFKGNKHNEDFWALQDVSFKLEKGKTIGIVGRNGAGKSTLLKLATRVLEPTKGTVRVNGRFSAMLELGTGFQPEFSARDNIFLNGAFYGFSRAQMEERYHQIVEFSELGKFIDTPVKHFSSGMYMRLGFAIALTLNPDILIIDEILAVGDAAFTRKCRAAIEDLRRNSKAMLFVSHSASDVLSFCDKVIYLSKGRIVAEGNPNEVMHEYMLESVGQINLHRIKGKSLASTQFINSESETTSLAEAEPSLDFLEATSQMDQDLAFLQMHSEESGQSFNWLAYSKLSSGLGRLNQKWEFNLTTVQDASKKLNKPEFYLALLNPHIVPFDFELMTYKQAAGKLGQKLVGKYQVGPDQMTLIPLDEKTLNDNALLELKAPQPVALELIQYEPKTKLEAAPLPPSNAIKASTHWYFPFCDVRLSNSCMFVVTNPADQPVEVSLTLYRDWTNPVSNFRVYQLEPFSELAINLNKEVAGGEGERHRGEKFYGGVVLAATTPIVAERYSLQLTSPIYAQVTESDLLETVGN